MVATKKLVLLPVGFWRVFETVIWVWGPSGALTWTWIDANFWAWLKTTNQAYILHHSTGSPTLNWDELSVRLQEWASLLWQECAFTLHYHIICWTLQRSKTLLLFFCWVVVVVFFVFYFLHSYLFDSFFGVLWPGTRTWNLAVDLVATR